jgi:hypothetical protein
MCVCVFSFSKLYIKTIFHNALNAFFLSAAATILPDLHPLFFLPPPPPASTRFSPPTKLHEICALFPRNVIQGTNNRWSLGRGRKKSFFLRPTKNKREIIELPTSMDHERRRMRVDTRPSIVGKITRLIVYMKQNN